MTDETGRKIQGEGGRQADQRYMHDKRRCAESGKVQEAVRKASIQPPVKAGRRAPRPAHAPRGTIPWRGAVSTGPRDRPARARPRQTTARGGGT